MTEQLGNTKMDELEGRVVRLEKIVEDLAQANSELRQEVSELQRWREVEHRNRELLP